MSVLQMGQMRASCTEKNEKSCTELNCILLGYEETQKQASKAIPMNKTSPPDLARTPARAAVELRKTISTSRIKARAAYKTICAQPYNIGSDLSTSNADDVPSFFYK